MARQRFVAPARNEVPRERFDAPIFAGFERHSALLSAPAWPTLDAMNAALGAARHPHSGVALRFVEQTQTLLADGLHYEARIRERGEIATRADNWHDLFNALMWIEHLPLKAALNLRQAADVVQAGSQRTRAQCAQTHFDEAGAIVVLRDAALLDAWDAHDWRALFFDHAQAWCNGEAYVIVFGHALLEHALQAEPVHTAKCLAVLEPSPSRERQAACEPQVRGLPSARAMSAGRRGLGEDGFRACEAFGHDENHPHPSPLLEGEGVVVEIVAQGIAEGSLLTDPQELRPLPLSGIPGGIRGRTTQRSTPPHRASARYAQAAAIPRRWRRRSSPSAPRSAAHRPATSP